MNNLLTNRTYQVPGNWWEPSHKLQEFPSVVKVELCDTTSSAGDWSGFFIQKIGKRSYFIPFSQDNNFPRSGGYTLYTSKVAYSWTGELSQDELYDLWNEIWEYGYVVG